MNANEKMTSAIDYIEDNLTNEISLDEIAKILITNVYMTQKIFTFVFGITIADYIRKRRLSEAAIELQGDNKVIDIALKYGYSSPEAFTRAFKKFHGFNPNEIKQNVVKIYPIIEYNEDLNQVVDYEIVNLPEVKVYGYKITIPFSSALTEAPLLWQKADVISWLNKKTNPVYGVLKYLEDDLVEYYIAHEDVDSLENVILPEGKWAVFSVPYIPGKGKEQLHKLFKLIGKTWLGNANHLIAGDIEFEYYTNTEIKYYINLK